VDSKSDFLIVGGGVIGTACAYYLTERGAKVTLIDRGEVGFGCSYGNGGLIVPSHSFPLSMPGTLSQAGKWLLKPDSPLYIKPRLSWQLISWLLRFLRYSTRAHLEHAVTALASLSSHSIELFDQLAAAARTRMRYEKNGSLYVFSTEAGMQHGREELEILRRHGVHGRELDEGALRELEPSVIGPVYGGTHYENEAQAEPLAVVQTFARLIEERGGVVLPGTELIDWHCSGRRIKGVRTTRGTLRVGQIILAGGAWSPQLTRTLGLNVPIQGGKGYAVTIEPFTPSPRIPVLVLEARIGVTPRADSVRLAGTLELAGLDETINVRRVDAIIHGARQFFALPEALKVVEVWRGLRPCTPDGLPLIGRHDRWENLTIAAGHNMLGLTLGPATGHLVADLLTGQTPAVDPAPFRPGRF